MQDTGVLALLDLNTRKAIIEYVDLKIADVVAESGASAEAVENLNAWATALATKLNADAGVTDVDYDTDPQAA
jgi:hypothetical protein